MRTFEGLSKKSFINILNVRSFVSNFECHGFVFNNPLCIIGYNIGLKTVNGKKILRTSNSMNHNYYKIIDVLNYDELIPIFNSFKVLQKIGKEYYIVKDNFNLYKEEIGEKQLSPYYFKKLSGLTGYKLIKTIKRKDL